MFKSSSPKLGRFISLTTTGLSVMALAALTACGGGGGGSTEQLPSQVPSAGNGGGVVVTPPVIVPPPVVCLDGYLLNDLKVCQKVNIDKTKALALWGKVRGDLYFVTKDGYVPVVNATPWNVTDANGKTLSTVADCGWLTAAPVDVFGDYNVACQSYELGGPTVWRALKASPTTGKLTHSGVSPEAANYVPANLADYSFDPKVDPATPDWAAKATIEAGTLFTYRNTGPNGVSVMFQAKEGGTPVVVGKPLTYATDATVAWIRSPQ